MNNINNKNEKADKGSVHADKSATEKEKEFKLPTLNQFMELVTAEQTTLAATPSGYNVYNKYNKSS